MCGICGIVRYDPSDRVVAFTVAAMNDAMVHRGPDDDGYFVEGNTGLGHRRLSIIDLEGGAQPVYNEDGSAVIVFNGEIYNYASLTEDLISRGHRFRTRSDTETIVHAYEEYGEDCVNHLRGMFAFAIWDRRRKRLMLARDRLGIKPLYYYRGSTFLAFASEIKALLELPEVPREVDREALSLYLSLRFVPGPRTMFRDIHKLQPGHVLTLDGPDLRLTQYWDIPCGESDSKPDSFYIERLDELLGEIVDLHLVSEVPLGVFLSGGLDSSAILSFMSALHPQEPVKAFSVGYDAPGATEGEINEFSFAEPAARAFQADYHEFRLNADDFWEALTRIAWHLDEPLADPSCVPLYFISRLAANHVTVVLSGEGADEILAGYGLYKKMLAIETVRKLLGPAAGMVCGAASRMARDERVRRYLSLACLPLERRYRGVTRGFSTEWMTRLTGTSEASRSEHYLDEVFDSCYRRTSHASPLNRMLYADTKVWLPDDLLLKADKMTMANSQELRVPFLDHRLVEFAATVPDTLKLCRGEGKLLLRHLMRDRLPRPVLQRSKKGFPVPTGAWLRDGLHEAARETLLAPGSAVRACFDAPAVDLLLREHRENTCPRDQELWILLMFEFWHRTFIQASPGAGVDKAVPPRLRIAGD